MLKGIDVSGWQAFPFTGKIKTAYNQSDFVIVKATQYPTYAHVNCATIIEQCKRDGKLWGFYHYATGQNPEKEAQMFYDRTKGYVGKGIPIVDWEQTQNKSFGNTNWVRRFVNKYYALTKVYPMIYVQRSAIAQVKNCYPDCALWVAAYYDERDNFNAPKFDSNIAPWKTFTVWQFSSSGGTLDRNVANITKEGWMKIAKGNIAGNSTTSNTGNNSGNNSNSKFNATMARVARDVIMGLYGNGAARKKMLEAEGFNYNEVQEYINKLYKIANDVIKGKYGNGSFRRAKIAAMGYDPETVQYIVNDILA